MRQERARACRSACSCRVTLSLGAGQAGARAPDGGGGPRRRSPLPAATRRALARTRPHHLHADGHRARRARRHPRVDAHRLEGRRVNCAGSEGAGVATPPVPDCRESDRAARLCSAGVVRSVTPRAVTHRYRTALDAPTRTVRTLDRNRALGPSSCARSITSLPETRAWRTRFCLREPVPVGVPSTAPRATEADADTPGHGSREIGGAANRLRHPAQLTLGSTPYPVKPEVLVWREDHEVVVGLDAAAVGLGRVAGQREAAGADDVERHRLRVGGEVRDDQQRLAGLLAAEAEDVVVAGPDRLDDALDVDRARGAARRDQPLQAGPQPALDRRRVVAPRGRLPVHRRAVHPAVVVGRCGSSR